MSQLKILNTVAVIIAASTITSCAVHGQKAHIPAPSEQQLTRYMKTQLAWQGQQIDALKQALGTQKQRIAQLEELLRGVRFHVTPTMVQVLPEQGFGD